jgi:hypothetical protein
MGKKDEKIDEPVIETVTVEEDPEQVLFTEPEAVEGESLELSEPWELDDVLLVCSQCGHAVRVPPLEKVPESCKCGLTYDHEHELTPTEIDIDEPTTLVVRKMARKW